MMKALFLSVKAGYGHHSTAKAMIDYFQERGVECKMLDIFEYLSRHLGNSIQDGYLISTKYLSDAYGKVYNTLAKKDVPYDKLSPVAIVSQLVSKKLERYVEDFGADFIVGTHSYAAIVMTVLARRGIISCPTIGIVTDFTVHPFWESSDLDYYVIPDALLSRQMQKKGIAQHKILPFGIPVKEGFSMRVPQDLARVRLELEDLPTVLVMMGSMGFGNIIKSLEQMDAFPGDFQIICVCGNNQRMKRSIDKRIWRKKMHSLGFVNYVDLLMDAADVIVTKPGGLTTSESMAKGLPLILMNPIPGQEERNMEFLTNNGAAVMVNATFPVDEALHQIFNCPWRLELMKQSVAHLGKPNATRDLYDFIMAILERKQAVFKAKAPAVQI